MSLLTNTTSIALWEDVVRQAEDDCSVELKKELEAYLVTLLMRYTNHPEVAKKIFATAFLEAMQQQPIAYELFLLYHQGAG